MTDEIRKPDFVIDLGPTVPDTPDSERQKFNAWIRSLLGARPAGIIDGEQIFVAEL